MSSKILGKLLQGGGERVEDSGREGAGEGGNSGGRVWGSGHEASEEVKRPPMKDRVAIRLSSSQEKLSLPPGDSFTFILLYFILKHQSLLLNKNLAFVGDSEGTL